MGGRAQVADAPIRGQRTYVQQNSGRALKLMASLSPAAGGRYRSWRETTAGTCTKGPLLSGRGPFVI